MSLAGAACAYAVSRPALENLQVTVLVPRGVCSSDLCLTGVINSFYFPVASSEITDTVQIKHTFKVRIFRSPSRKDITPSSKRNSTLHSWAKQEMYFWQLLLAGTVQETFLPSLVAHCASPPPILVVAAPCATCPLPAQGAERAPG